MGHRAAAESRCLRQCRCLHREWAPLTAQGRQHVVFEQFQLKRQQRLIGDPQSASLPCYNATALERRLAVELDIPLNGLDPDLLHLGTKTGNRRIFAEAGVDYPAGSEDLRGKQEIVDALIDLGKRKPGLGRAVVKLNEGFGGEGNGVFTYPAQRDEPDAIRENLLALDRTSMSESISSFLHKFDTMGGVVEELVAGDEVRSPSVQMRISPAGVPEFVSSHEQVLGGATGQSYLGCSFPADDAYRQPLMQQAAKVGKVLAAKGVIGRFAIDFLVSREPGGEWRAHAIEINLRMGGTTPPFHALEFLTGGRLDEETGLFRCPNGRTKFYAATDNLKSPDYHGLLPEDLFEIVARHGIGFSHVTGSGCLFHMIGALSQYGKVGMVCIADSPADARALFDRAADVLDEETGGKGHGVQVPLLDRYLKME